MTSAGSFGLLFPPAVPLILYGIVANVLLDKRIHEASAFTALYVLVIEIFVYRDVSLRKDLPRIVRESMTLVGAILIILTTAIGFTSYLIQVEVPMKILAAMQSLITSKLMFLLVLNVFLLIAGMLMDIFAAIFVVVPLIVPIARHFEVNPYHLGIVFLLNLEIGNSGEIDLHDLENLTQKYLEQVDAVAPSVEAQPPSQEAAAKAPQPP